MENILKHLKKFFIKEKIILIGIGVGIFLLIAIIIIKNIYFTKPVDLEEKLSELVSKYYDENIKGTVTGIDKFAITLADLEKAGIDISDFKKCEKVMSYIIVDDPSETDKNNITYKIENHLECEEKK